MIPPIAVVICSFNGERKLALSLLALSKQLDVGEYEVIVVDDGSSDHTATVAGLLGVRVIRHETNLGLAAARNTGWQAARAPLVAFTDDDCKPDQHWLAEILSVAARWPDSAGYGGEIVPSGVDSFMVNYLRHNNPLRPLEVNLLDAKSLRQRLVLYLRRSSVRRGQDVERPVSSLVGANMAFRRTALSELGGFDDRFRFGGEEEDLCRRITSAGGKLMWTPNARVTHIFESAASDTFRRSKAYGKGNARMYVKHGNLFPTIYPVPICVGALLVIAAIRRRVAPAIAAVIIPNLVFARWPAEAYRKRAFTALAYPYVQTAQEAYSNAGFWLGLREADGTKASMRELVQRALGRSRAKYADSQT